LGEIQAHTQTHIIQSMPIDVELSCQQLLLYTGLRSSVWVNRLLEEVPKKSDDGAKNLNKQLLPSLSKASLEATPKLLQRFSKCNTY
jgi:hypothetical protein